MKGAVIGLGAIGPVHINALIEKNVQIVALCDIDLKKCVQVKEKFSLDASIYEDYLEMLDKEEIDVVHICTPHYLHASMICEALKRDINVLTEKPLAISLEQLDEIENAVKSSKAQLGVCFQNRFNSSSVYVRNFLKDKEIVSAYCGFAWQRDKSYYDSAEWRGTVAMEGGGVMINQAIHSLDLLILMCGMPTSVTAHTHNISLKGVIEVEDTAIGVFNTKDNCVFSISATNAVAYSFPFYYIFKTKDDVVTIADNHVIINDEILTKSDKQSMFGKDVWGSSHSKLIENYYKCIENGEKFEIDFYEGSKAIKALLAMYRSNGEKIDI